MLYKPFLVFLLNLFHWQHHTQLAFYKILIFFFLHAVLQTDVYQLSLRCHMQVKPLQNLCGRNFVLYYSLSQMSLTVKSLVDYWWGVSKNQIKTAKQNFLLVLYVSQLHLNCIFSMSTLNMFSLKGSCFEDLSHWTGWNWKKDIMSESAWLRFLSRSYHCRFPSLTHNCFDKKLSHFQYYFESLLGLKIHNKCYQCCLLLPLCVLLRLQSPMNLVKDHCLTHPPVKHNFSYLSFWGFQQDYSFQPVPHHHKVDLENSKADYEHTTC